MTLFEWMFLIVWIVPAIVATVAFATSGDSDLRREPGPYFLVWLPVISTVLFLIFFYSRIVVNFRSARRADIEDSET